MFCCLLSVWMTWQGSHTPHRHRHKHRHRHRHRYKPAESQLLGNTAVPQEQDLHLGWNYFFYYYHFLSLFLPKLISSKKLPSSKIQNKTHHQNKPPLLWWKWMRRGHAEISDFFFSLDLLITEASSRRAATSARSVLHHHPRKSVTPSWREKGTSGSTVPSSAHTSSLRGSQYFSSCSFPNSQSWDSALWGYLQALCGHPHWQVL